MNNRGQLVFYGLMLAVVIIIIALVLAPVIKSFLEGVMAPNSDTQQGLDCKNESISDAQKGQCMITDWTMPYFILGLLAISGAVIGARVVLG